MNLGTAKEAFEGNANIEIKSALPGWICLYIRPDLEARELVVDFFRGQLSKLPADLANDLASALHELLGNSFEHGCSFAPECATELSIVYTDRVVMLMVKDDGPGFAMDDLAHAALNNPTQQPLRHIEYRSQRGMRPGGFGILMVKRIADELIYNEKGNGVLFLKYLP